MFGESKQKLKNEIKYLENKIKMLEEQLEYSRKTINDGFKEDTKKRTLESLELAARKEPVMIDFDKVDVWSIERMHRDGKNYTIVGTLEPRVDNGVVVKRHKEYNYFVNSDGHQRLIAAYEAHRMKKGKKS